jgi:two-component system, sensor histidine kinase ChiS
MRESILFCLLVAGMSSCLTKNHSFNDNPAPIFPSPKIIPVGIEKKYTINPLTGDSIKPLKNSKGELVKTGVPIPAIASKTDSGFLLKPKIVPANWSFVDSLPPDTYPVWGKPDIVHVDENKFSHFIIGKDTSSQFLLDMNNDTVITGIPVQAKGEVVICKKPIRKKALPMSIRPNSKYNIKHLGTYHGLNSSDIRHIMEDSRGNLWLSTGEGLTCFDGIDLFVFTMKEGLLDDGVFYTHEDRKGNIWIDYGNKGVSRYDGKNFTHFRSTQKSSFITGGNCAIAEDKNGILWFKNLIRGLTRYDGKTFTHYTMKEGLSSNVIRDIMVDSKNRIWLGTHGGGVSVFNGTGFIHIKKKDGLNHDIVSALLEDRKGNIWIGTDSGFAKYDGKTMERFTKSNGLSGRLVGSINEDSDGNIWFGTYDNGVTRFDGRCFMPITEKEGLPGKAIMNMCIDKKGGHWFAGMGGISYFHTNNILSNNISYGTKGMQFATLITDHDGNLLMGPHENSIVKKIGNNLYRLSGTDAITGGFIIPLLYDRKGNFWFSVRDAKLNKNPALGCFDGKQLKLYISKTGHSNDFVSRMIEDQKGNFWIGSRNGLLKITDNFFTLFTEKEGLSNNDIRSLIEDQRGNIWIGSGGGLTKYDGVTFTHYTESEGLPRNFVSSMAVTGNTLWISTLNAIVKFDGENFIPLTEREGLPANNALSLIGSDPAKNIWLTSRLGITRIPYNYCDTTVNTNDANAAKEGINNFTERDGISPPVQAYINPASEQIFLHSATSFETYTLAINKQNNTTSLVSVNLKEVIINDKRINFHEPEEIKGTNFSFSDAVLFSNVPTDLKLPHRYNSFSFQFSAKGEAASQHNLYSYRMEGIEKTWSTPSAENVARYPFLPPGKYTFKVRAMNRQQQWGPPTEFSFLIHPPFWKRWWFLTLMVLLIAGIVYWIFQRRISNIKKREEEKAATKRKLTDLEYKSKQAVLGERLRISSDLHDEVGATLSGIAMYSHLTKEQLKSNNISGINNSLEVIQQNSSQMVDKLNDIVWFINPEQDSIMQLISRLEDYIYKMAAIKDIHASIKKTGLIIDIPLSTEVRRNIYLFCKEAINNSVKHSNASILEFSIEEKKNCLEIIIKDNGKAFDTATLSNGNGLKNMQKRADDVGADFSVQSRPGEGCRISLVLKFTQQGIA